MLPLAFYSGFYGADLKIGKNLKQDALAIDKTHATPKAGMLHNIKIT